MPELPKDLSSLPVGLPAGLPEGLPAGPPRTLEGNPAAPALPKLADLMASFARKKEPKPLDDIVTILPIDPVVIKGKEAKIEECEDEDHPEHPGKSCDDFGEFFNDESLGDLERCGDVSHARKKSKKPETCDDYSNYADKLTKQIYGECGILDKPDTKRKQKKEESECEEPSTESECEEESTESECEEESTESECEEESTESECEEETES